MKSSAFFIFFSIVITLYSLLNFLVYIRGIQALSGYPLLKPWYSVIFGILALTYIVGRFLEKTSLVLTSEVLTRIGSFWLAAFFYFLLVILVFDILRAINYFLPYFPEFVVANYLKIKLYLFSGAVILVASILVAGYINARNPRITKLTLTINKEVPGKPDLHIVFVSDIHLGTVIRKNRIREIVEKINSLKPDLIIMGGDVVDEDIAPVIRQNLGEELLSLKAPLGVISVTGNHEYIGGADAAVKYLREHGLNVLRDTAILVDGRFYIAGREDKDRERFTGKPRKEITDILSAVDKSLPIILIDHQPFHLEKAEQAGVDLQLSGHTHHGQLWPFGYITSKIYEVSRGYKKKGNSHFFVSTGLGTWGPPVRTGNRPEIVDIHLSFLKN